jgi:prepilin-type N-terminal cleavage/methylation domain-containing protein/prepilin-type processing-associated H-X9-DG protein
MHKRKGFTLIELLVVIAIIAILMAMLMPVLNRVKEQGKRAVCLFNLKQLTLAWFLYADDFDDKLVNGEVDNESPPGEIRISTRSFHKNELYWVGRDWHDNYMSGGQLDQPTQIKAIRLGALFSYDKTEKLYRCPTGIRGESRTYSIVDSMNGLARTGTITPGNVGVIVGRTVLWVKKKSEIVVPSPAYRIVFLDEGRITPDSYAVHYNDPPTQWWDPPFVRHGDGTNVSYADGRSEYWKYKGVETIKNGKLANPLHQFVPTTPEGKEDLYKMQRAVWGRLSTDP